MTERTREDIRRCRRDLLRGEAVSMVGEVFDLHGVNGRAVDRVAHRRQAARARWRKQGRR